ncbi:MAG: MMPL family transporter [Cyclobacteriaceae bacterium]|nr:MMPL family transporter [Cyclobacteriaceae bacterium]
MWTSFAHNILRFRLYLIVLVGVVTAFMGYQAQFVEWSYNLANIVPENDPEMVYFNEFKKTFGEDGNILALGIRDSSIYEVENFQKLTYLSNELGRLNGIKNVLGLTNLRTLTKNSEKGAFEVVSVFSEMPEEQEELDSLLGFINNLQFYSGQLVNESNGATLLLVTIDKEVLNSENRNELVFDVVRAGEQFEEVTGIDVHFAGLPYVRSTNMVKIKAELNKFLIYSIIITGIILFLFFRSVKAVFFPLIIIGVIVVWVMGTLSLFGFEITILTGLIPSIIVVIGIPNSVYMLNKYHHEYSRHGDKEKALSRIIQKIGIVTFITNFTTAVGFFVLIITKISILVEFGIIAGINIMATFLVSIILIPAFYSYLKPPSVRHLRHLDFKILGWLIMSIDQLIHRHRTLIFLFTFVVGAVCAYGIFKIEAVSYMVDDLPDNSPLKKDLAFFESNFAGIMPLEVIVDTGAKRGVQNLGNLKKIDEFEEFLDSIAYISQPVSVVSFIKGARQAFYNQNKAFYALPNSRDSGFILKYLKENEDQQNLAQSFVDSTGQKIRISLKIADIGSSKMDSLVNGIIRPKIDEIFGGSKMDIALTGTTLMFIKGNKFLIENLISSMIMAFFVIAIIMGLLFRNLKMIIISLIPNIIPLVITAGIMGFTGIPLKPSTALIFSIAFGISVDYSIHFLAKYRQELFSNNFFVPIAITNSLKETGVSMIYTSVILFFGFVIFAASEFGGTVALGKLTSITLLFAMLTNVIVLPALLLQFDSGKRNVNSHPLIEQFSEEADDEEEEANEQPSDPLNT